MVEVLNALGVHCACVGNHDFDYGVQNMEALTGICHFPWLLSNIKDRHTGCVKGLHAQISYQQFSCDLLCPESGVLTDNWHPSSVLCICRVSNCPRAALAGCQVTNSGTHDVQANR